MTNPHALIIDDNATNLDVLAGLLDNAGFTYTTIKDPSKVKLELPTMPQPDVVLCDLEMPKVNGYEMLEYLRAELGHSAPIIACTVHTSEIETARKLGFDGFLGKPLDADRFPMLIGRILQRKSVWELP